LTLNTPAAQAATKATSKVPAASAGHSQRGHCGDAAIALGFVGDSVPWTSNRLSHFEPRPGVSTSVFATGVGAGFGPLSGRVGSASVRGGISPATAWPTCDNSAAELADRMLPFLKNGVRAWATSRGV